MAEIDGTVKKGLHKVLVMRYDRLSETELLYLLYTEIRTV